MSTIVAALDSTAAARPVLESALRLGEATGCSVEVVHVVDGSTETPGALAARFGVPLRVLEPPPDRAVLAELGRPEVLFAVVGARATSGGRRPVGRVARRVLERAGKPIVVVPPETVLSRPLRRLLLPLEGTDVTSRPILEALRPILVGGDVELVVLHVFTNATLPRMLDRPGYDLDLLAREFLAHHCPGADVIELRVGPVARRVAEVAGEHGADMVVLSWHQDTAPDRALVVREVLGASALPVLLLPIGPRGLDHGTEAPRGLLDGNHSPAASSVAE